MQNVTPNVKSGQYINSQSNLITSLDFCANIKHCEQYFIYVNFVRCSIHSNSKWIIEVLNARRVISGANGYVAVCEMLIALESAPDQGV